MHLISHKKNRLYERFYTPDKIFTVSETWFCTLATKQSINKNMFQRPRSDYSTERDF